MYTGEGSNIMLTLLKQGITAEEGEDRLHLLDIIESKRITPHFQPIIDTFSGEIYAYEVLTRCEPPFENPARMFALANEWNLNWELERACRAKALETIATYPADLRDIRYFFNVSPHIFSDPRFVEGTTVDSINRLGLDSKNIVFEITEIATVEDYDRFEELIRYYVSQGFQVALDDFGAGHSGMVTLVAMTPHFLKLDMALVQGIAESGYKQNLVRAITSFAAEVGSACIAEGIENQADLMTLFRLGVRYAQGFYLGRPAEIPRELDQEAQASLDLLVESRKRTRFTVDVSISGMVIKPATYQLESITCRDMDRIFRKSNSLDHVVLMKGRRPWGILPRSHFYSVIGGQFGYSLFQKKFVETVAKTEMLCLDEHTDLRTVGRLAMERSQENLYDPVIITNEDADLVGTVTMKQIIHKAFDLEIKVATCANPLTQLPGNMIIGYWLEEAIQSQSYSIVYCDLDNFKAFNDTFGFTRGDEVLQMTGSILNTFVSSLSRNSRLGHIGGDDYIVVCEGLINEPDLAGLCEEFDRRREELFPPEIVRRGWYEVTGRRGGRSKIPLLSLSIAVVTSENFSDEVHPGKLGQVAALIKKQVKSSNMKTGNSGYLVDRRVY